MFSENLDGSEPVQLLSFSAEYIILGAMNRREGTPPENLLWSRDNDSKVLILARDSGTTPDNLFPETNYSSKFGRKANSGGKTLD